MSSYGCLGYKVRFSGCTALVTQLLEAREDRQLQRMLTQLQKQDLLILDELGYVPFENWTEVCGSERLTGAMLDRLTHRVHIIEANGESYRLQKSRKRITRPQKRTAKN